MCDKFEFSQSLEETLKNIELNFLCSSSFHYFCLIAELVVIVINCSAWRIEGSEETLFQPLNIQKGVMSLLQGFVVPGEGEMVLS